MEEDANFCKDHHTISTTLVKWEIIQAYLDKSWAEEIWFKGYVVNYVIFC